MKEKFKQAYMDIATRFAQLSYARRLQVGAVIVKNDSIISLGYNGTPAGWDNNCEDKEWMPIDAGGWISPEEAVEQWPYKEVSELDGSYIGRYRLVTKPEVLHAEMNSLMKLAKSNESGNGASMFVTHSPCLECAKGIYQAGIKEVYFKNQYRSDDGINFLKKCKIHIEKI